MKYLAKHRFADVAAVVECRLLTGRTHQIRVHLAHIGHPLIGDPVYGSRAGRAVARAGDRGAAIARFPRQALHARLLGWRARARGRVARIRKRTCHITIRLAQPGDSPIPEPRGSVVIEPPAPGPEAPEEQLEPKRKSRPKPESETVETAEEAAGAEEKAKPRRARAAEPKAKAEEKPKPRRARAAKPKSDWVEKPQRRSFR